MENTEISATSNREQTAESSGIQKIPPPKLVYDAYVDLIDPPSPEYEIIRESPPPHKSHEQSLFEVANKTKPEDCNM